MLFVCPTPIGNLEDITLRVLRVLQEADYIVCEDTRRTIKLLNHYNISKKLVSLNQHTEYRKKNRIIEDLCSGMNIALVSDAGTPGIQDPGRLLICDAISNQIPYTVLPGASALVTALVASGLCEDEFLFLGFLPRKTTERKRVLEQYASFSCEIILYEAPHRLRNLLDDLRAVLGNRELVLTRELTKLHEEYVFTTIDELLRQASLPKGELVIVIKRTNPDASDAKSSEEDMREVIFKHVDAQMKTKEIAKEIAMQFAINKNEAYHMVLQAIGEHQN